MSRRRFIPHCDGLLLSSYKRVIVREKKEVPIIKVLWILKSTTFEELLFEFSSLEIACWLTFCSEGSGYKKYTHTHTHTQAKEPNDLTEHNDTPAFRFRSYTLFIGEFLITLPWLSWIEKVGVNLKPDFKDGWFVLDQRSSKGVLELAYITILRQEWVVVWEKWWGGWLFLNKMSKLLTTPHLTVSFYFLFLFFCFLSFLGMYPGHMEVPRLGV